MALLQKNKILFDWTTFRVIDTRKFLHQFLQGRGLSRSGHFKTIPSLACCTLRSHLDARGVLMFGFGKDVPLQNSKVDPSKYQFFKEKWPTYKPIIPPINPILDKILSKISPTSKILWNLSQCWLKFGKILKNRPILISNFKGHYKPRGSFCYPCWRHIPVGSFVLSTPPPRWYGSRQLDIVFQRLNTTGMCSRHRLH